MAALVSEAEWEVDNSEEDLEFICDPKQQWTKIR
jgi:hypothetical protein